MAEPTYDLERTFLALDGRGKVVELPVGPDFWARIEESPAATGTLVSMFETSEDWPHWEMHPAGDEVLVLLEGRLQMILDQDGVEQVRTFEAGQTLVVPAGAWHRARVLQPGRMLAITFGAGTRHRPVQA